jgi:hypothetical protein
MIVYKYDENGIYTGETTAQESPREPSLYLMPPNTTAKIPPEIGDHECAIFGNESWDIKPDYRDVTYWLPDGTEHTIDAIDVVPPENALYEKPTIPLTPDEQQAYYSQLAQNMMDEKARERNYDNIASACSYTASTNSKFAAEAAVCVEWRDAVWVKCYELLNLVLSDKMDIPEPDDFLSMLPTMTWPDETEEDDGQTA